MQHPHQYRHKVGTVALCILCLVTGLYANTSYAAKSENSLKAALVLHFSRYIQWPDATTNLQFCVAGDDIDLYEAMTSLNGKESSGKRISVQQITRTPSAAECHLIYFSDSDRNLIASVFATIREQPVVTIAEIPEFDDYGGIIRLYTVDNKLRFSINLSNAEQRNLSVSARLIQVAHTVIRD